MTIIHSTLKKISKLQCSNFLRAKFYYPKLIIFEDATSFRLLDLLETKENDIPDEQKLFKLHEEITDCSMQDHILWIALKSGEFLVTDILHGSQIKIIVKNQSSLKFQEVNATSFFFKNDGGEYFKAPFETLELTKLINEGENDLVVSLKKINLGHRDAKGNKATYFNGLRLETQAGKFITECPLTGQKEIISSRASLRSVLCWGELVILTNETKMWVVDLENSCTVFNFENENFNFVPVMVYNDIFFYLTVRDQEVNVCQARNCSTAASENGNNDCSRTSAEAPSTQEALMSELNYIIDSLIAASEPAPINARMQILFEKIEALDVLIEAALKLYSFDSMYKPILYVLQKSVHSKNDEKLKSIISEILVKVDLIEYIVFRGITYYDKVNLLEMNSKQLCITFISKMDFDIASICWLKYSELKLTLVSRDIIEILNAIPEKTKMSAIIIWLKNFVPSLLEQNPFYIDLFVRWTMERIFMLEQSSYWPKIGLKFVEQIATVLESSLKIIYVRPISMDDLDVLKDRINYIQELKEKYKINMLLSELSSQSPSEVALIMMRRCYTEDLGAFLQDYLPTYATRHLFDIDEVLRNFVESETASSGGTVDGVRLEIILNSFRCLTNRMDCLLNVLKVLDVPWSSNVLQLAIDAAGSASKKFIVNDSDCILAQEIQKELNYANVKVVLKKYDFPLSCTEYTMVLNKLISASVVDLNDLKAITTVMPFYANYGNALYVNRCLEDCDTRSVLSYFQNLQHKEKSVLIKVIVTKYEQIINGCSHSKMVERNYIDFLKSTQMLNDLQLNNVSKLYHLKNSYYIELDINHIYNEKTCALKFKNWLKNDNEARASSAQGGSISRLIPTNEAKLSLLKLLRGVSATHRVRTFVECLIKTPPGQNYFSKDVTSILVQFRDGQNASLLFETCNILIELVNKCEEEHLHNLIKHLSILNALLYANVTVKNLTIAWKYNYVFLPISSATAINEFIDFFSTEISIRNNNSTMNKLNIQAKCDLIPFRIISNAVTTNTNFNDALTRENILGLKGDISKRLLLRVVAAQELDEVLTTVLLVLLKSKDVETLGNGYFALDLLKSQSDSLTPSLSKYISTPAIRRTFDTEIQGSPVAYPPQYILKSKFNIDLSEITLPENNEETWDVKVILFYILKQYPETTFERLFELCKALSVSMNDGMSLQLISLLSTWDLKYKIFSDELGCHQIRIENNTSIFKRCSVIWDNIENRSFLKEVLIDFWKNGEVTLHGRVISVNPYYYEVFLCIYHFIYGMTADSISMKEYHLLHFLKDYKRVSAPKQYEFELFSVKGMFPEIGHYRLPFHLFVREDMWSNLKSEITLETYERWLPVVSLLSLDKDTQIAKDMICSNALKQTMTTRKQDDSTNNDSKEKEQWRLTSREEPLLRAAHRCVRHIANMEWAGACLFYVLQGCTRGADQVAAAQLCYQFAQRWAALQPGNRAVRQMERLHSTLSTRHVLFKIEWACEEFLRLSTEPAQLIRLLYLHPEFVNKIARHDVNRAATEIADKNNINISSIRIQILENLLDKSTNKEKRSALNSQDLMTAKYILKATCPKMGAIYLSRIAFDDDSDNNKCRKMRALQCLISVVEPDTAMKVANRERDALWMSLLELLSIVKLENIDMPWLVVTFLQEKCRALEQLLQIVDGNVDGLKIAADLACHYGNTEIIRNLITLLLRSNLFDEMIPLLLKISGPPDTVICSAWRAVIISPFQCADYPITERQKLKCITAINLLPICPVVKDDDLKDIWKNCARLKCLGLGCLVLPYMTHQARQSLTELQKIDRRNLIASLKNLHAETYLVSGAMHVLESMTSKAYR